MIVDWTDVLKLLIAAGLGALLGFERERTKKPAGLRTHMLVALGSALFTIISIDFFPNDPARIAAGIVTGIGFLGAGTIFRAKDHVQGLTTAASVWTVAAVGMAVALGYYALATIAVVLALIILELDNFFFVKRLMRKQKN